MNLLAYPAYQAFADLMLPWRAAASLTRATLAAWPDLWPAINTINTREIDAWCELIELAGLTHARPPFGIDSVLVDGERVMVTEEAVKRTPFATLLRFRKERQDAGAPQPRVLLVAPMSGHFATLLRGTVRTMLADHDVYITDWHNPRDVPLAAGRFGFDEYVEHLMAFIRRMGPDAHLVAICQPTVAALAAVALMAADNDPAQPASMTLMAGPIDCRVNPTAVNDLANSKPIEWFERNLIGLVPGGFAGARRRVYPGFVQLGAFMSMNLERHLASFADMRRERAQGDAAKAQAIRVFYEEYFATSDLTAEFYLETVRTVFQEYALPLGKLKVGERLVEPHAIRHTALLTVEGEKDDICAVGQTVAAQELCSGLRPYMKTHHVQTGAGHYGVFNGRRWDTQIYPLVRSTIHAHEPRARRIGTASSTSEALGASQVTLRGLLDAEAHAAAAIAKAAEVQPK
ncbi:polyhydroxyalkanoate depolymerase [Paraburkholderia bannensis]|uniref:Polyhydroxyalkanoate depolymerase n=1 Tax=Paraburkholderia bannensis TaxID=765414 RepID=A0A7W9U0A5_9BURK|nr:MULTISPECIES: polyhydroxyalkanoate depolymerase [Paraburkholderia]MBB3259438.1 polyhydroxyalkanoate depolymerase [Paraburkholderia sp. WP4_3_2]MBB6104454.1 polyhydroxyalkanoate depolymerase [Paraburkholderia bannensis]